MEVICYGHSMKLVPYQQCRSLDGWQPVIVESATDLNVKYQVLVNPWGNFNENVCECRGYQFRGQCHHQEEARMDLCGWSEARSQEVQNSEERKLKICPRCKGMTYWEVDVEDE